MTEPPIVRLIHAARGKRPVDLLLRNARLINVYLGEVVNAHIAITDGHIAGFGACEARHTLDLKRRVDKTAQKPFLFDDTGIRGCVCR